MIDCTEPRDKIRERVERESCGFSPIDFCIVFWNSTFTPDLEFTEGIFLTASALFKFFLWPTQLGHIVTLLACNAIGPSPVSE